MSLLPIAGVLTENPSDAVTAILAFTGLFGGAAHYTQTTVRLFSAIVLASVLVIGLVELLNGLEAAPGIAALSISVTAVVGGALLGVFVDRLPE
jgi:hypothetical protein